MAIGGAMRSATGFEVAYNPGKETPVDCSWQDMALGNQTGNWKTAQADIKYAYDHNLKGEEISVWWPGRGEKGECNDLKNDGRGCWYRAKLLNDVGCREEGRCLHFAAHDGEPRHTYSCPTWVRDDKGVPCRLPDNWQACPLRFNLKRVDTGVPQDFKQALSQTCAGSTEDAAKLRPQEGLDDARGAPLGTPPAGLPPIAAGGGGSGPSAAPLPGLLPEVSSAGPQERCLGSSGATSGQPASMLFDLRHNAWYRCTDKFRCEAYDIRAIRQPEDGECGKGNRCRSKQQCFVHRVTSKQSTHECLDDSKVWLISDGDDAAKFFSPAPLAVLGPPPLHLRGRQQRRKGYAGFL